MDLPWVDLSEGCFLESPKVKLPWTMTPDEFSQIMPCERKTHLCPFAITMTFLQSRDEVLAFGGYKARLLCDFFDRLFLVSFSFPMGDDAQGPGRSIKSLERTLSKRYGDLEDVAARIKREKEFERTWLIRNYRVRLGRDARFSPGPNSDPYFVVERGNSNEAIDVK